VGVVVYGGRRIPHLSIPVDVKAIVLDWNCGASGGDYKMLRNGGVWFSSLGETTLGGGYCCDLSVKLGTAH